MPSIPRSISNGEDLIDSRDIIARIDWLEDDEDRTEEDQEELDALKALAEEASGSPDWIHGEGLIRDSYFETYARDLADDIGAIANANWPLDCIDWEQAANELKMDYTEVDFDGVSYFIRS